MSNNEKNSFSASDLVNGTTAGIDFFKNIYFNQKNKDLLLMTLYDLLDETEARINFIYNSKNKGEDLDAAAIRLKTQNGIDITENIDISLSNVRLIFKPMILLTNTINYKKNSLTNIVILSLDKLNNYLDKTYTNFQESNKLVKLPIEQFIVDDIKNYKGQFPIGRLVNILILVRNAKKKINELIKK
ncbi:TPA: hypothetical protein ACJTPC_000243 [Providencia alcalifaciens]